MSVCHPNWRDDAACRGMAVKLFYPGRGESAKEAKATCATCPVAGQCLEAALAQPEAFGVWGGTSERQRRAMRKQLQVDAA